MLQLVFVVSISFLFNRLNKNANRETFGSKSTLAPRVQRRVGGSRAARPQRAGGKRAAHEGRPEDSATGRGIAG